MSKIMILGFVLPAGGNKEIVQAHNIRSQQFLDALLAAGNEVVYIARAQSSFPLKYESRPLKGFKTVDFSKQGWRRWIQAELKRFQPDCFVSTSFFTSYMASFLKLKCPVWMDINGDPIAEKQAKLFRLAANKGLFAVPSMESRILRSGDKFSTCSRRQRLAVIGKLGLLGRLNQYTFGYDFVHAIPPGLNPPKSSGIEDIQNASFPEQQAENDFILLWTGGYNVWMDPDTLFLGIEAAMKKDNNIRFVSTGGPVVHDGPYRHFRQLIENSPQRHKFSFLGWIPRSDLVKHYQQSDLGISIDVDCYETELGTRTRLLEMIGFGLPVLISRGTEIGDSLVEYGLGRFFAISDHKTLTAEILSWSQAKQQGKKVNKNELAEKAHQQFNNTAACESLLKWSRDPVLAPDYGKISRQVRIKGKLRNCLRDTKTRFWGGKYQEPEY